MTVNRTSFQPKICKALNCTLDDIMEFIPEEDEKEGEAND